MVTISHRDAERFLTTRSSEPFALLFHGPDSGLVNERVREAVRRNTPDLTDPFAVVRISAETLLSDPARLSDEANTMSLWSGPRSIWIDATAISSIPALESLLAAPVPLTQIVIEAGELRRDAPLRRACEQSPNAAAFECDFESGADLDRLIVDYLQRDGTSIAPAAKSALTALLTSGRLSTRSELDKLSVYMSGRPLVELRDVEEIVSGAEVATPDLVAKAALDGSFAELTTAWSHARSLGIDGPTIAGFALRSLLWRRPNGSNDGETLSPSAIRQAIHAISTAIREGRREPRLADALALRSLWSLARLARRSPAG